MARRDIVRLQDPKLSDLKVKWERDQVEMKKRCCLVDIAAWQLNRAVAIETSSESEENSDNESWHSSESCKADSAENDQIISGTSEKVKICKTEDVKNGMNGELVAGTNDEVITYVAGTDISFVKGDDVIACASLVVIKLPKCEVVYEDTSMVEMEVPYIPGFLAFREAPFFIKKLNKLKQTSPELMPQAVLVDGNGILHVKEFGLACHIGVGLNIPSVGVAKTLFHVDGLEKNQEHQNKIKTLLQHAGDTFPLVGNSGTTYGVALRCHDSTTNPIYVSQGHNISLDTAVWLVKLCSKYRIPEPIRQADIRSREFLRKLEKEKDSDTG